MSELESEKPPGQEEGGEETAGLTEPAAEDETAPTIFTAGDSAPFAPDAGMVTQLEPEADELPARAPEAGELAPRLGDAGDLAPTGPAISDLVSTNPEADDLRPTITAAGNFMPAVPMAGDPPAGRQNGGTLVVAHVADRYKAYPGDAITFFTRVQVVEPVDGFVVRVQMPLGTVLRDYRAQDGQLLPEFEVQTTLQEGALQEQRPRSGLPILRQTEAERVQVGYLVWRVAEAQESGAQHEYEVTTVVERLYAERTMQSEARVYAGAEGMGPSLSSETVTVAVQAKGNYLKFLPALYERDDFMGRFLMLFESFWRPIDQQIGNIHYYFDPQITPARFLPWLASWFDLTLDEQWTEAQQRRLVGSIMRLYRMRGTRPALQEYLEIYTERPVEITERRARDFRLGVGARLGVGVAVGKGNRPFTFLVKVQLPEVVPPADGEAEWTEADAARIKQRRENVIKSIIEAEKPAHTQYTLEIEYVHN